jgi:hypothetical protein
MVPKEGTDHAERVWDTRIDKLLSPDDTVSRTEASFGKTMSRVAIEIVRYWKWK